MQSFPLLALCFVVAQGPQASLANSVSDRYFDQQFNPAPKGEWLTNFNQEFKFQCPDGGFVNYVSSRHSDSYQDRIFDLECGPLPLGQFYGGLEQQPVFPNYNFARCYWTDYLNTLGQPVVYQCPANSYVAGLSSFHDNDTQDRRFKLRCCQVQGTLAHNCSFSGWLNAFENSFTFNLPENRVLTGMASFFDDGLKDRRYQLQTCTLDRQRQCPGFGGGNPGILGNQTETNFGRLA